MEPVELAVSKEVFERLADVPLKVRKKLADLVDGFQRDSRTAAMHLESISSFKDKRARTARVGDDWRAIIVAPEKGNRYLLVYVDHHDEAMRWARNKIFDIHPVLGSIQVVDVVEAEAAVQQAPRVDVPANAFAGFSDEELVGLGLPAPLLPSVRMVKDADAFKTLAPHLPGEAAEGLGWLLEGVPVGEVHKLASREEKQAVDTTDFEAALTEHNTQRRFVTVKSALDLEEMLTQDVAAWRVFLHPEQRKTVVGRNKGPFRLLGGPGTGKTVVAMHRARQLVDWMVKERPESEKGEVDDRRVLVTTFSRSLAQDIHHNLKRLCTEKQFARMEVTHLHSWAVNFLRKRDAKVVVANDSDVHEAWKNAIGVTGQGRFTEQFIRREWVQVIQVQNIRDEQSYLRASRKGRGGPLLKKEDRVFLWKVFQAYREALDEAHKVEWTDVVRQVRTQVEALGAPLYRHVVVDEVQDFGAEELKLVRALAPRADNDLFLVGDPHQRIFSTPVRLSSCGIDIVGRSRKLHVNYRTTHEIREYAVKQYADAVRDDLDASTDDLRAYTSILQGPPPREAWFSDAGTEQAAVVEHVKGLLDGASAEAIGVIVPTKDLVRSMTELLDAKGIPAVRVDDKDELPEGLGVRVCTMHRSKGLEFHHVVVCGLGKPRYPYPLPPELMDEPVATREHVEKQSNLLLVASTRARETLWVSGWGERDAVG